MSDEPKLSDLARRLVCRIWGHQWRSVVPRNGQPISAIFRQFTMCWRCGKLDR